MNESVLIVKSVVINVRCHPCATSVGPLLYLSFSLFVSLSLSLFLYLSSRLFSFSFSLHSVFAPSVSFLLIIPYLYLGPFGSQWRYLACSDWVETPPNLITQSVGRGVKEVAMAVSLHTACTFRSTLSVVTPISLSIASPSISLSPFPSYSHFLGFHYLPLLLPSHLLPSFPPTEADTDIEGLNHWQSDSNYE